MEQHDVVNSGVFEVEFSDKQLQEWTRAYFRVLEKATEEYMIEVSAIPDHSIFIAATEL